MKSTRNYNDKMTVEPAIAGSCVIERIMRMCTIRSLRYNDLQAYVAGIAGWDFSVQYENSADDNMSLIGVAGFASRDRKQGCLRHGGKFF